MISFSEFVLDNGLQVIVHEDKQVPVAVLDVLYKVGSKNENPAKTGFAHLFEHLMFGGSANIPSFDTPLQKVGGDNNAFTSPDITNYYITLPANNIETAFWLESDRMLELSFNPEVLDLQKKVVIEEFKQRYLNQPFGDAWLKLRPLVYEKHPYGWPTIGKEISHIENATMEDVKDFFYRFYRPDNAVLVVAGNVSVEQVKKLANKWFGNIPSGNNQKTVLPKEPAQTDAKKLEIQAEVPVSNLYKIYHMCEKLNPDYTATDLLSDTLGRGKSSRLYEQFVKQEKLFTSLNASISGSNDPGMFVISGTVANGIDIKEADKAINGMIADVAKNGVLEKELNKVKNQAESSLAFAEIDLLSRAMSLAIATALGDTNLANKGMELIEEVELNAINRIAKNILIPQNSTTLYYTPN